MPFVSLSNLILLHPACANDAGQTIVGPLLRFFMLKVEGADMNPVSLILTSTVVGAIAGGMITWIIARWQTRKNYKYRRSQRVTERRFDLEIEAIQEISEKLYVLVCLLECSDVPSKRKWDEACNEVKQLLGRYAPILDYRDENGRPTCGVAMLKTLEGGGDAPSKVDSYAHACSVCNGNALSQGNGDTPSQLNMFNRVTMLLKYYNDLYEQRLQSLNSTGVVNGELSNHFNDHDQNSKNGTFDSGAELAPSLEGMNAFINFSGYSWMRLKSIETGRRDKRWDSWKEKRFPWRKSLEKYDAYCLAGDKSADRNDLTTFLSDRRASE